MSVWQGWGLESQKELSMPQLGAMSIWGAYLTVLSLRFLVENGDGHNYLRALFKHP